MRWRAFGTRAPNLKQASTANIRRVERSQRQYGLFAGLYLEGSACGHVSENRAGSFRNRYALHKCNSAGVSPAISAHSPPEVLDASWQCFTMTFDNHKNEITGGIGGVAVVNRTLTAAELNRLAAVRTVIVCSAECSAQPIARWIDEPRPLGLNVGLWQALAG